jgi:AraC family transcriptional regulator
VQDSGKRPRVVPVSTGTVSTRTTVARGFTVIDARFPPGLRIPTHTHEPACVTVVLEGEFSERLTNRDCACTRGSILAKPPLEPHDDLFGRSGSRQLIIEVERSTLEEDFSDGHPWDAIVTGRAHEAEALARGLSREMLLSDSASRLAIEGLTLELLAHVWRMQDGRVRRSPPPWLQRARALLDDRFHDSITVVEVARAVDIHPTHLAREFRSHFGESVGQYVRRLRVDWAKVQLLTSSDTLACIAIQAGFSDQAHFTRWFKRQTGLTPHRYRSAHGLESRPDLKRGPVDPDPSSSAR